MIDPINFTRYDLSDSDLEEVILFCCAVAGKNALTTAKALDKFLVGLLAENALDFPGSPFDLILGDLYFNNTQDSLAQRIKSCGMGCYRFMPL